MLTLFNNGSILEINDYCNNGSRGKLSLTELSEIINTLSIQEMRLKMNKKKKIITEMKVVSVTFLVSPSLVLKVHH